MTEYEEQDARQEEARTMLLDRAREHGGGPDWTWDDLRDMTLTAPPEVVERCKAEIQGMGLGRREAHAWLKSQGLGWWQRLAIVDGLGVR